MNKAIAIAIGTACLAGLGGAVLFAVQPPTRATVQDQTEIYDTMLRSWLRGHEGHQFVSNRLSDPPVADSLGGEACAKGVAFRRGHPRALKSLDGVTFQTRGVRIVDGEKWSSVDPGRAIARGESVEGSVEKTVSASLISFSQPAFSRDGKDALVDFSMTCGPLCGFGTTMHLSKSDKGWAIVGGCGEWMS